MAVSDSAVQVKNLDKNFGTKNVLAGITMTLEKGEIIGLVGPNGAGKTTLIKLLVGLLHPSGGSVSIYGRDRDALTENDWRRIAYIADEPNLYDFMTVRKIIDFNRGFYPQWDSKRCADLLQRFHLSPDESVKNLSRGMKTQLSVILALAQSPDLLVLDEPLEGLDPVRRLEILNLVLEDFMQGEECSILISSHYLEELERIADRIAFLHEGRLKRIVPMAQLKGEEKTIRVVFQKEPPESLFRMPGIREVRREGRSGYLLSIEDNFNGIYEACSAYPHFVLDIYHRNLEDMFYDYSGEGDKNGLK